MIKTYDQAINVLGERVYDLRKDIGRKNLQRRSEVVDLYGVEYTRDADGGAPATFYVSLSPDLIYLERFAFKLIIQPFISTVGGGGSTQSATVSINATSLSVSDEQISPNPHSHESSPHTHNIVNGVTMVNTDADDFSVSVADVDITEYLMAQMGGRWISGEGIYPDTDLGDEKDLFDILQVATDLNAENRKEDAEKLLSADYKSIKIASAKPFRATVVLYCKYSHMNR